MKPGQGLFRTPQGKIRKIHNLRPILKHARREAVSFIGASAGESPGEGLLHVDFRDGTQTLIGFASYKVCVDFIQHPRRVWNSRGDLKSKGFKP